MTAVFRRAGPVAALLFVIAVDVAAFAFEGPVLGTTVVGMAALAVAAGGVRVLGRAAAGAVPLAGLTTLLYWLYGLPLGSGLTVGLRLVVLFLAALWASSVVAPRDLLDAASRLHLPVVPLAARFAVAAADDARRIREAQALRGLDSKRVRAYRSYLVPLFVVTLRRAQATSRALALAEGRPGPKTHTRTFPWYGHDVAWVSLALIVLAASTMALRGAA